jgi:CheY-like chemotaxis protein
MTTRILIIEDTLPNLELARFLLEASGYEVLAATDGQSGLDLAQAAQPALVLCDLQMPVMNGYEVLKHLRQSESAGPRLPVIAFTAYSMAGDREKVLTAGFDGYVSKPIEPDAFAARIEGFLRAAPGTDRASGA